MKSTACYRNSKGVTARFSNLKCLSQKSFLSEDWLRFTTPLRMCLKPAERVYRQLREATGCTVVDAEQYTIGSSMLINLNSIIAF